MGCRFVKLCTSLAARARDQAFIAFQHSRTVTAGIAGRYEASSGGEA